MSLLVRDVSELPNGCDIIAVEGDSAKWLNARKMPRLIRLLRVPDLVDEPMVRVLLEDMKKLNLTRAAIVTSSGFSRTALDFANSRPIDLYSKDQLQEILDKVDIYGAARRS
jgi:hypothetical protein